MEHAPEDDFSLFNDEQREAFIAFRENPEHETWDVLSQVWIKHLLVMDVVKQLDPSFPDPYPLAAGDIAGDDVLYWPQIPSTTLVYEAMVTTLEKPG